MSYTTINNLPEKLIPQILGSENLLLTDYEYSYKVTLDTLNEMIFGLDGTLTQTMKNKIINDVSNFVHANAIHYSGIAMQDISKGTPVKVVQSINNNNVYVDIAGTNEKAVGICEDDVEDGELGSIILTGVLSDFDTSSWAINDLLYSTGGVLTNVQPASDYIQFIGYVLNSDVNGKILINANDPFPDASQFLFDNSTSNLTSLNVQDAIVEIDSKIQNLEDSKRLDAQLNEIDVTAMTYDPVTEDLTEVVYATGNKIQLIYDVDGDLDYVDYYDVDSITKIFTQTLTYDLDKNLVSTFWSVTP
jgi:hypothetical protein